MSKPKVENILSDSEKVEFLNSIKGKGEKPGKDWVLIHSSLCTPDEAELDFDKIVNSVEFKDAKFAIDIVSNPNRKSFLDSGRIKIRYRYGLAPEFSGEPAIKDNTREFCEAVINKDVVYRREDINMMSFRGANPIAKTNYSIFRLKGHWNCRHAWYREIYLLPPRAKAVNKGTIIKQNVVMSKNEQTVKQRFGKFMTGLGRKLTQEEIVEITSIALSDETIETKFVDVEVDGKTLRIDGEKIEKDLAVSWVDGEGNLSEVENSEIATEIEGKQMILVIEDRKIKEVKDVESSEAADAAEQQMSEVQKSVEDLKKGLPEMIATALEAKLSENNTSQIKVLTTLVDAKLKALPAFKEEEGSQNFNSQEDAEGKTMLERMTIGQKKK